MGARTVSCSWPFRSCGRSEILAPRSREMGCWRRKDSPAFLFQLPSNSTIGDMGRCRRHGMIKRTFSWRAAIESETSCQTASENEWSQEQGIVGIDENTALENAMVKEKTMRLVESAMLAAAAGLAYFLSNLLRLEAYFGCFFPLPVVISSMRWGPAAGRKTMVATAMLLLVLSGPLKTLSYLLMHGFVGLAMGSLWSWRINWGLSIAVCAIVRSIGALGFVMLSSLMLRENLLVLITVNAHASFSYILAALGVNMVPTMPMIYVVFALLLLLNCGSFVFLLHVLYAIFLRRLGIKTSISFPVWIERAI